MAGSAGGIDGIDWTASVMGCSVGGDGLRGSIRRTTTGSNLTRLRLRRRPRFAWVLDSGDELSTTFLLVVGGGKGLSRNSAGVGERGKREPGMVLRVRVELGEGVGGGPINPLVDFLEGSVSESGLMRF